MGRAIAVMSAVAAAVPGLVLTDIDSPWAGSNLFTVAAPVAEDNDDEAEEEEEALDNPAVVLGYWLRLLYLKGSKTIGSDSMTWDPVGEGTAVNPAVNITFFLFVFVPVALYGCPCPCP